MEFGTTIDGTVTTALGVTPLVGIQLQLLNATDASAIRTVSTDASGTYSFSGLGLGDYRLRTSNGLGYEDLLYDSDTDISCNPFCDPLSGSIISTGSTAQSVDFDLSATPVISGNVTDNIGSVASGIKVEAYDTLGTKVAFSTTDADGDYSITNLWAGTFHVRTANIAGFVDALYDGQVCGASCDPTSGTSIALLAGMTQTGIDLQMGSAANISGTVTDGTNAISGVTIELYLDTGGFVSSTTTDGSGAYSIGGLTAGDYHLVSRNNFGFVDEGADGGVCQSTCAPTSTASVTVATNASVTRNMTLDPGGEVTGTVFDSGTTTLPGVTVIAFNDAGVQISSTVTDSGGSYLIRGLVAGNVYLRTSNAGQYRNQSYDGLLCDAFCDVLAGSAIVTSLGNTVSSKDFHLDTGYAISGTVQDSSPTGIGFVLVEAFDATGTLAGSDFSVTGGAYAIDGLAAGDYQLRTTNGVGYIDLVLGGDACTPEPCATDSGIATSIVDADMPGVDITLDIGSPLSGVATDTSGNPLPTGAAWLYSATGNFLKSAAINSGLFNFTGIADGIYYMLVKNDLGLVDQLWEGVDCPSGSCDFTSGTAIEIGTAPAAQLVSTHQSSGVKAPKTQAVSTGSGHLRFTMPAGTTIKGSMHTEDDEAIQLARVYIFRTNGKLAAEATTDGLGNFETEGGLQDGSWYAATQYAGVEGVGGGLTDEVYADKVCAGDCDPVAQQATKIVTPGAADQVHFILGKGGSIEGVITSASNLSAIAQVQVDLFDNAGNPVAQTSTDGLGVYAFEGLLDGTYRALATPQAGNFGGMLYNGIECDAGCDILSGSTVVLTGGSSASNINFALIDDNCPGMDNPDQVDSDGDGKGDACEGAPPDISSKADVDESAIIGDGVQVKSGVVINENADIGAGSILNRNVRIGASCILGENVIIEQSAKLGAFCEIGNGSYVGKSAKLGVNVKVGTNSIIGKDNTIGDGAVIGNDVEFGPGVDVGENANVPDGTVIKRNGYWPGN